MHPPPARRLDSAPRSAARLSKSLARVAGLNLGGGARGSGPARIAASPSPPPLEPGVRRRSGPGVPPAVQESAVAPQPLPPPPPPPLIMGPGLRPLLPLVLCVGLSALVPSAGASGFRKRGPSVTAKVTGQRAAGSKLSSCRPGGWGSFGDWTLRVRGGDQGASTAQRMGGGRGARW